MTPLSRLWPGSSGERKCGYRLRFFDLPLHLRERIYADVCREDWHTSGRKPTICLEALNNLQHCGYCYFDHAPGDILALLSTCHQIHDEAFKLVCSSSELVVRAICPDGLQALRNTTPAGLASLRELTVHLDLGRQATPNICYHAGHGLRDCPRHREGTIPTSLRQLNLRQWQDVLCDILPHLPRTGLCLNLICELESVPPDQARSVAMQLLSPLHGRLTLLRASIRLSCRPDAALRALARELASSVTEPPQVSDRRPSLLDLPPEIRLQILRHTDLVTRDRAVWWRPECGYTTRAPSMCIRRQKRTYSDDIICRNVHAAYCPDCHCWLPPTSLFLTCRTIRLEAEQIFFQNNRILLTVGHGQDGTDRLCHGVLTPSYYLTRVIPERALRHLRFLQLEFPSGKTPLLDVDGPPYQDWLSTLRFVSDKLLYSRLTLRVFFWAYVSESSYPRLPRPLPLLKEVRTAYQRALRPLSILRAHGLCNLHVDVASPFQLYTGQSNSANRERLTLQWANAVQKYIETHVMGQSCTSSPSDLEDIQWRFTWLGSPYSGQMQPRFQNPHGYYDGSYDDYDYKSDHDSYIDCE